MIRLIPINWTCLIFVFASYSAQAFGERVIFFRNDLTTDATITIRASQRPQGVSRTVRKGGTIGFTLASPGRFDLIATSADDGSTFIRQGVDLQTLLDGMGKNNVVSVRGVFDCELIFDHRGGIVVERRIAVTFSFPLKLDHRPFTVTAGAIGPVVNRWRCQSMDQPSRPSIYESGAPAAPAPEAPAPTTPARDEPAPAAPAPS